MDKYTIFKLKNLTPLHIGTGKENYDFSASNLQSDTLSAALATMRVQKKGDKDLDKFLDSFCISSAFPFVGDKYYLPKPQGKLNCRILGKEEHEYRKSLKNVRFVESSLWGKLINGECLEVSENQIQNDFLISDVQNSFVRPCKSQVNQRVMIPRGDGCDAEPFFFEWNFYNANSGLYCIVKSNDKTVDELRVLFEMLGDFGLGTDKNIGGGKFECESIENVNIFPIVSSSNASMLLSLYIPTKSEVNLLDLPNSRYELLKRGGYMAGSSVVDFRHLRKKSIYMFNVGSVFNTTSILNGKIVDLKPDWNDMNMHHVYRSGKPFIVPIKIINQ